MALLKSTTTYNQRKGLKQKGLVFLETLLGVLIFSVGLLSILHMQTVSTIFSQQSYGQIQLLYIVNRLFNITQIHTTDYSSKAILTTPTNIGNCQVTSTTLTNEINCFYTQIARHLPHGTATISQDKNGLFTITVYWLEKNNNRPLNEAAENCRPPYLWSNDTQKMITWPAGNAPRERICLTNKQWRFLI